MIEGFVLAVALVLLRTASFVAFVPPLGQRGVPATVKVGLAVALTVIWAPIHAPLAFPAALTALNSPQAWLAVGWLAGREVFLGLALAWGVGLAFASLKVAGSYISQEMGLNLGALTSPLDQQSSTVVAQLLETIGTLLFFSVGAHHAVLRLFAGLFHAAPVGADITLPHPGWMLSQVNSVERLGLELAAPVGVGLFLVTILLAVQMRWSPQFNLLSFGTAVRVLSGLGLLALLLPDIVNRILIELQQWTTV